jgi:hypothetical protein
MRPEPRHPRPPRRRPRALRAGCGAGVICLSLAVGAAAGPGDLCLDAARLAADLTGVPLEVLVAIGLTESGRGEGADARPWPWTLNVAGEGLWLDGPEAAEGAAREAIAAGMTGVDIGCFQINYRWHGEAFADIAEMLDPAANALYAADFLARLRDETGGWPAAVAAYHSRTEEQARRYLARYEANLARVPAVLGTAAAGAPPARLAALDRPPRTPRPAGPLFGRGDGPRAAGSLVPLGGGG